VHPQHLHPHPQSCPLSIVSYLFHMIYKEIISHHFHSLASSFPLIISLFPSSLYSVLTLEWIREGIGKWAEEMERKFRYFAYHKVSLFEPSFESFSLSLILSFVAPFYNIIFSFASLSSVSLSSLLVHFLILFSISLLILRFPLSRTVWTESFCLRSIQMYMDERLLTSSALSRRKGI